MSVQKVWKLTEYLSNNGIHGFLKGISPKVNAITQLEIELTYLECVVKYFSHYSKVKPTARLIELLRDRNNEDRLES